MAEAGRKTHLYSYHADHGKMVEFAGFQMPLWYTGIAEEHMAVRNAAGIFDVSHMGRFMITGPDAARLLDHLMPTSSSKTPVGRSYYSALLNEKGGIVDDTIILRMGEQEALVVVNAVNRRKDMTWMKDHMAGLSCEIKDLSDETSTMALQGPLSEPILSRLTTVDLSQVRRFSQVKCGLDGTEVILSRTGYTGEDGFEIFVPDSPVESPERSIRVWERLIEVGRPEGLLPAGLGARDALRIEAGMCLWGQDIDENTTPFEASLGWIVNMDKPSFIGRDALLEQEEHGIGRLRVCLAINDQGIPRSGYEVVRDGRVIGRVTSGTFSPLLKKGIGMAYVLREYSAAGDSLTISARGRGQDCMVVRPPFYDTSLYGWKRTARGRG